MYGPKPVSTGLQLSRRFYRNVVSIVWKDFIDFGLDGFAGAVALGDPDDVKDTLLGHTGILPLAISDGESLCGLIPANRNERMGAFLVVVIVAFVFVKVEAAIGSAIDAQLDWTGRLFVGVLDFRAQGKN
jgi:hypothetical protein